MTLSDTWHLGFDIGGTKCAVTLGKRHGDAVSLLDKKRFETAQTHTADATITRLCELSNDILASHHLQHSDIQSIGISCGGPLDSKRGLILSPPNLPGWDDVPIVQQVEYTLKIRTFLENDANACALAEWHWGVGQRCDNMIFMTFGTGMGAGLILNGKLYRGTNDLAGEVGHIRLSETGPIGYGKAGSFEGFCSGGGLAHAASQHGMSLDAQQIFEHAANGDEQCIQLIEQMAHQLGRGLALLIDLLNPQKIILGSLYLRQQAVLDPIMLNVLKQETLSLARNVCQILPAGLGEAIGDYAALAAACNGVLS